MFIEEFNTVFLHPHVTQNLGSSPIFGTRITAYSDNVNQLILNVLYEFGEILMSLETNFCV